GFGKDVTDHGSDHVANQRSLALFGAYVRMAFADRGPVPSDDREAGQLLEVEDPGPQAVVDVVIVVGNVVRDRRDLRLEAWPASKLKVPLRIGLGHGPGRPEHRAIVLREAPERFPAEVEPVEAGIWRLELRHEPDGVGIVVEPSGVGERRIEGSFSRMAERRMAEVMGQAERFGQVLIEPQRPGDGPPDLGDFDAVGQADAEMVPVRCDEDLGLVPEAAERDGMDYAVAVALEDIAGASRSEIRFRMK